MGCFTTILLLVLFILTIVSIIRWFEQITEAVDNRWWNQVFVLVAMPFTVWLFPSRTSTGRPTPVPHHEPIRGFGLSSPPPSPPDAPPPGTPKEFLGMPQIPPPKPRAKSAVDPDKIARLKQKMREQGMLPPDDQQ